MNKTIAALLLLVAGSFAAAEKFPSFQLPDPAGKVHASTEYAGKPVLIDFWATWCATCKESVPQLVDIQKKYAAKGLEVVGISVDKGDGAKVAKGARKLGITYTVLHDAASTMQPLFGYNGVPSLYLYGKDGALLLTLQGYDPTQEKKLIEALDRL
jgi:cytochrome c biogenesis protein CcmG, thiol:disulfide interchange protein DsbE